MMWNLKKRIQINLYTKQKQFYRLNKQICGYQRGQVGREGYIGVHTIVYGMDVQWEI